jgi:SP family myo-inositol transporter-like MFS transporter 13
VKLSSSILNLAYALGLGHAPWLIQSEIFPLNVRGRASGIGTGMFTEYIYIYCPTLNIY